MTKRILSTYIFLFYSFYPISCLPTITAPHVPECYSTTFLPILASFYVYFTSLICPTLQYFSFLIFCFDASVYHFCTAIFSSAHASSFSTTPSPALLLLFVLKSSTGLGQPNIRQWQKAIRSSLMVVYTSVYLIECYDKSTLTAS